MATKPDDAVPALFFCGGFREGRGGKMFVAMAQLDSKGKPGAWGYFAKNSKTAQFRAGQVYEIPVRKTESGESIVTSQSKWVRQHADTAAVEAAQAESMATLQASKRRALEKREGSATSALDQTVVVLRRARDAVASHERVAFDLWLLDQIRH